MVSRKKRPDQLGETVMLAHAAGMSYAEYQRRETLGLVKIANGKLLFKGKDYCKGV